MAKKKQTCSPMVDDKGHIDGSYKYTVMHRMWITYATLRTKQVSWLLE